MFREMRLDKQKMSNDEIYEILNKATNGVLAVLGDDDYPYTVPLSFSYLENKIYFHSTSALSHKIDGINKNPKVSFCVVSQDNIIADDFNTLFKSVIIFGKARVLTDKSEIHKGIMAITKKYSGDYMEKGEKHAEKYANKFLVVEIDIEHLTGKSGC